MRLSFVLLTIVATLLASSEARLLRQGISTKTAGLTSENNAESEERRFIVRSVLSGAITKAESAPLKTSKWDKVLNKLAKIILPDTSDYRLVYKNGRLRSESYF
ncbi:hypothetical protein JG687_00016895 [Phytophthora cactorum]|uniref:RxLR effector protein n=1 Tax=Phytophthora cactorum TaxID=29920 RepID=A0A8T1TR64_9STRA|nr:hypothetical protein GQ600_20113 [Phytophthora cactorum]KAG3016594.1 hypothetical protein PC120_g11515 [Phytophthora cactorum]KAG3052104.1 hypothetical protein PC121_g17459 [Phytophthora cactorum]KAG4053520.1 hypothetical protein PC123_g11332 [Phytophthora cactorum]KAG6946132.1 hypothetical protein JG687_00016895 [Phytophthora cactorum]